MNLTDEEFIEGQLDSLSNQSLLRGDLNAFL